MEVHGKNFDEEIIKEIISEVRKKRNYSMLDEELIRNAIKKYLTQNPPAIQKVKNRRSGIFKKIVKFCRAEYYDNYAAFQTQMAAKRTKSQSAIRILNTHLSTRERLGFYNELYKSIFRITGKPASILDLGCGINPCSFKFMKLPKKTKYIASDISRGDLDFIDEFFIKNKINGKTVKLDIANEKDIEKIKAIKADICFLFKVLDSTEAKKRNVTYQIMKAIDSKHIIASFSRKNIKGEFLRVQNRPWFERFMRNLGHKYSVLTFENEIFYVVAK